MPELDMSGGGMTPGMDMGMDMGMGGGAMPEQDFGNDQMMGGQFPADGGMDAANPFDTNFDAGVEADEETDPKRYIQQLTGKLSQSLRSYNEGLPQPDADLSKYVAGMIVKQASEGLSQGDVKEILDKLNGENGDSSNDAPQEPNGNEMPQDMPMDATMGEAVDRVGGLGDADGERKETIEKLRDSEPVGPRRRAFTPKRFK